MKQSIKPRRALIVSFEVAREDDLTPSLAVGSLLAYAGKHLGDEIRFEVVHHAFRVGDGSLDAYVVARQIVERIDLCSLDLIAVAAYAWSERLVCPLMEALRDCGFTGDYLIGGYQVTPDVLAGGLTRVRVGS